MATDAAPAISLSGVGKTYESASGPVVALEPTDLTIGQGEFVVLLGPSGCGKTTLLRMLAGLETPTAGTLTLEGHSRSAAENTKRGAVPPLGMVFQAANLFPWLSTAENIALPLKLQGVKKNVRLKRANELCELVGLSGFETRYPRELSGGMQQRAAIARALAADPDVLLMDEPFGALDAFTRDRLNLELQRLWMETGKTIVLVTHSITEAIFLADTLVVLSPRPGRVVKVIPVDFPRARTLETQATLEFQNLVLELRQLLEEDHV